MEDKQEVKPVILPVETKHLVAMWGIKGTTLRRILRSMVEYNDGQHTNYRWASLDCAEVLAIKAKIDEAEAKKATLAAAAKLALEERIKALEARKALEAKIQAALAAKAAKA